MKAKLDDLTKINYIETGSPTGIPLVFIHGFPFNYTMWQGQLEELPDNFRKIAFDVRGHGLTEGDNAAFSIAMFAADLCALLDALKIEKCILCGLSMGGYIALNAITFAPDRFIGAVLCDTKSEGDSEEAKLKRLETIDFIHREGLTHFVSTFTKNVLAEKNIQNKNLTGFIRNMILSNKPPNITKTLAALADRKDMTRTLSKISFPVLVIVGEQDSLIPVQVAQNMALAIPGAKFEVIKGAGHMPNLEEPEVFNKIVSDFLDNFQPTKAEKGM